MSSSLKPHGRRGIMCYVLCVMCHNLSIVVEVPVYHVETKCPEPSHRAALSCVPYLPMRAVICRVEDPSNASFADIKIFPSARKPNDHHLNLIRPGFNTIGSMKCAKTTVANGQIAVKVLIRQKIGAATPQ